MRAPIGAWRHRYARRRVRLRNRKFSRPSLEQNHGTAARLLRRPRTWLLALLSLVLLVCFIVVLWPVDPIPRSQSRGRTAERQEARTNEQGCPVDPDAAGHSEGSALVESEALPPVFFGDHRLSIQVVDAEDDPVPGARVEVSTQNPRHHGSGFDSEDGPIKPGF